MDSLSLLLKHAIKWRIASVIFLNNTLSKLKLLPHPCANEDCNGFALGSLQISAAPFGGNFQPLEGSADVALIQPDLVPKKIKESKDDQEDVAAGTHKRGCD